MKGFLLLTWLGIAGAGYYGYTFYQQSLADAQKSAQAIDAANASNADLTSKVAALSQEVSALQEQLGAEKRGTVEAPLAVSPAPTAMAVPPQALAMSPTSIPSTITTLTGKTYTGCVLSRVTPDGISFMHSTGVAKVLFSDLDPAFAATFGYDLATARKYAQDQAAQQAQSDAERAAAMEAQNKAAVSASAALTTSTVAASSAQRTAVQSQIASLQGQITALQADAQRLDAADQAAFNSWPNIYYNSTGQVEHRQTMGHSQQAIDDRAQIQSLQTQIAKLQMN